MIVSFKAGVKVVNKYGEVGTISFRLKDTFWRVPGYLGDGFYEVITPAGQTTVERESDLRLAEVR